MAESMRSSHRWGRGLRWPISSRIPSPERTDHEPGPPGASPEPSTNGSPRQAGHQVAEHCAIGGDHRDRQRTLGDGGRRVPQIHSLQNVEGPSGGSSVPSAKRVAASH